MMNNLTDFEKEALGFAGALIERFPRKMARASVGNELFRATVAVTGAEGDITLFSVHPYVNDAALECVAAEVVAWALMTGNMDIIKVVSSGFIVHGLMNVPHDSYRIWDYAERYDRNLARFMRKNRIWDVEYARQTKKSGVDPQLAFAVLE